MEEPFPSFGDPGNKQASNQKKMYRTSFSSFAPFVTYILCRMPLDCHHIVTLQRYLWKSNMEIGEPSGIPLGILQELEITSLVTWNQPKRVMSSRQRKIGQISQNPKSPVNWTYSVISKKLFLWSKRLFHFRTVSKELLKVFSKSRQDEELLTQ